MSVEGSAFSVERSGPSRAVFLSYAREDTDAARRIAEALRGFGVEVWFDQNELRGGDQWDAKIRGQIKACALFIPVISTTTQTREEAYFRLEWKLADDRSHLMAPGKAFVVPVVIDDTPEAGAVVPDSFGRAQWTRLAGGQPSTAFIEQVKHLLQGKTASIPTVGASLDDARGRRPAAPLQNKPAIPVWIWGALAAVVVAAIAGVMLLRQPTSVSPPSAATPEATPKPAVTEVKVATDKSIAVLPFTNMSEDKDTGFFADGVHEDLLTNLAIVPELKVISRTSVLQYRGTTKTMRQIGQELGVAYLLEGSVRRSGNKVRITGQLINTRNDQHIWAKSYDRDLTDIFAIQSAIAQEIATALSAALSPEVRKHLDRRPTDNPAAYDLFLKGRIVRNDSALGVLGPLQEAERLYQGAVDLDPKFAAAWGELAVVHALYGFWGLDHTPGRIARGEAAMQRAENLAPEAPDVIRVRGSYAYYAFRDYDTAIAAYGKLAVLQPNDPTVYSSLGLISRRQGRMSEAVNYLRRAVELDPASFSYLRNLAITLFRSRRWDEQRTVQQRIVAMRPDSLQEQFVLAYIDFDQKGSTQAFEQWMAGLAPAIRESPVGIYYRKQIAWLKADAAEYRRLDRIQPYYADQESAEVAAMATAAVYAAEGDLAAVRERIGGIMTGLHGRSQSEPANVLLWLNLGIGESTLGNHAEAIRLFRKMEELLPESKDAMDGPWHSYEYAMACARSGDKERALTEVARLLKKSSDRSVHYLRVDPGFSKLRGDPRFEALLNDPKNNAPLY